MSDAIFKLINQEKQRQSSQINLIPSENYTSREVRKAVGSVLMHKYSEGNVGRRYYAGNKIIDEIEKLAQERALDLFKAPVDWAVNVQALSGSYANLAAITAVLEPGDTILSMFLPDGGHLSHGWSLPEAPSKEMIHEQSKKRTHVISKLFNVVQYKTDPKTNLLDYDLIQKAAEKYKPKMIITGGTSYPRNIDYAKIRDIANKVGAYYLADVAHEAGLIAAGALPSPIGVAHIVTMTTHKTLRSARGSLIFSTQEIISKVNRAVLPGIQGGPFNNNIAGIAVGLAEASTPAFKKYAKAVIENAQTLAAELVKLGYNVITGGTDKHLVLVNITNVAEDGKIAAEKLEKAGIILNMNTIPWDDKNPSRPSGIRLGTPFVTTQGMDKAEMKQIAKLIDQVLREKIDNKEALKQVRALCQKFKLK